jgi:hypothetical protein
MKLKAQSSKSDASAEAFELQAGRCQMKIRGIPKRMVRLLVVGAVVLGLVLVVAQPILTAPGLPLLEENFTQANVQGFGDRQNGWAWSMQWWKEKLYVGTNRAEECTTQASLAFNFPDLFNYPPTDPDVECTDSPQDLPLQAEIWRWDPESATWERVYQSPNDVEIPGYPGKYVARDIGFRGMTVFTEADGTEALYVAGVTSRAYNKGIPPPRILRSIDGTTFEPVPQDPGTFLGDLESLDGIDMNSFRSVTAYNGRLYVIAGRMRGDGVLLEGENPSVGNDNFRMVSPPGLRAFDILPFNGFLYVATYNPIEGYSVLKTDATGTSPYTFIPVVTNGGFAEPFYGKGALSMHIFKGRLYVGTDRPAEVIRINPDDSWDLIVGRPRETPDGMKSPLSGFGPGFDYEMNVHIWRMQAHDGWLYAGTCDQSTAWKEIPFINDIFEPYMGFDLFTTPDGEHFTMITRTGFDHRLDYGVRTFASTPYGLFLGTANEYYGTRVFRGVHGEVYTIYLPLMQKSGGGLTTSTAPSPSPSLLSESGLRLRPALSVAEVTIRPSDQGPMTSFVKPPERLEVESQDGAVVLSWELPSGTTGFHIYRSDFTSNRQLQITNLDPDMWIPGSFSEIGTADQFFFVDTTALTDQHYYHYYVLAEDAQGNISQPSNLVRAPSLAQVVTFDSLGNLIADWAGRSSEAQSSKPALSPVEVSKAQRVLLLLTDAHSSTREGDFNSAIRQLEQLDSMDNGWLILDPWRTEDLDLLLARLARRVRLAQIGLISPQNL